MHICLMTRSTVDHRIKGGLERHAADICQGLAARGHRITVVTTQHPDDTAEVVSSSSRILFLPHTSDRAYSRRWWAESAAALARLHREATVDLIWSQSIGAYGYLRRPAEERAVPCVSILHGTPLGEWRAMRRQWGLAPRNLYRLARFGMRTLLFWRKFCVTSQRATHIICVSPQLAEDARQEFKVTADAITVIPNGVNTSRFAPDDASRRLLRSRLGISEDDFTLLTAGRLEQAKGHQLAFKAAARLRDNGVRVRILVAGSGPDEAWLRQQADALGIAGLVHWLGFVPHEEMPAMYNASDATMMLSLHTEAFPYAVVEAMACGRPVVASRVGGIPSAIAHGQDGFVTALGDVAMAAGQAEMLARDAALRAHISQAAREKTLRQFSLEQMVAATERVFQAHALRGEARP